MLKYTILCNNSILHMNEPVLHLEVWNQNGVQSESHRRSESAALQKQTAELCKHNSHYFTDTIQSHLKLCVSSSYVSSFKFCSYSSDLQKIPQGTLRYGTSQRLTIWFLYPLMVWSPVVSVPSTWLNIYSCFFFAAFRTTPTANDNLFP
jgi:hypothetical protein